MSLPHDPRLLERSYYRRVEVAVVLALGIHGAAFVLVPPYVARPYRLDTSPLRLVAPGRVGTLGAFVAPGAGAPKPLAPRAGSVASAPSSARYWSTVVVTEQLRVPAPPAPSGSSGSSRREPGSLGAGSDASGSGAGLSGGSEFGEGEDGPPPVFYAFDSPPRALTRVTPEYPNLAKAQGAEGSVVLNANVDERGRVVRVWVAQSTAPEILVEAAIDAMYRFRFAPGSRQGFPVKCTVAVPFNFRLNVHL